MKLKRPYSFKKSYMKKRVFGVPRPLWIALECLVVICGGVLTVSASLRGSTQEVVCGIALAVAIYCWYVFYLRTLEHIVSHFSLLSAMSALVYSIITARLLMSYFSSGFYDIAGKVISLITHGAGYTGITQDLILARAWTVTTILIGIALWVIAYLFFDSLASHLMPAVRSLTGVDVGFIVSSIVLSVALVVFVSKYTAVFSYPTRSDRVINANVIYNTETGGLLSRNVFMDINATGASVSRPLYGLYTLPFGVMATWAEGLIKSDLPVYAIVISFFQVLLLSFSMVLFARLLHFGEIDKLCFLAICFVSYPFLLFVINTDRQIFALFWTALYLNALFRNWTDSDGWRDAAFAGAVGTSLQSLFLVVFSAGKDLKKSAVTILRQVATFISVAIVFGQFHLLLRIVEAAKGLPQIISEYSGSLFAAERVLHFTQLIERCLLAPQAMVSYIYPHVSYQLAPSFVLSKAGCVMLGLALIGFLLSFRDKYSLLCLTWLAFTYTAVYTAPLSGDYAAALIYTLPVSWALYSLIYKGISKAFSKLLPVRVALTVLVFIYAGLVNVRALRELILFGIANYPI